MLWKQHSMTLDSHKCQTFGTGETWHNVRWNRSATIAGIMRVSAEPSYSCWCTVLTSRTCHKVIGQMTILVWGQSQSDDYPCVRTGPVRWLSLCEDRTNQMTILVWGQSQSDDYPCARTGPVRWLSLCEDRASQMTILVCGEGQSDDYPCVRKGPVRWLSLCEDRANQMTILVWGQGQSDDYPCVRTGPVRWLSLWGQCQSDDYSCVRTGPIRWLSLCADRAGQMAILVWGQGQTYASHTVWHWAPITKPFVSCVSTGPNANHTLIICWHLHQQQQLLQCHICLSFSHCLWGQDARWSSQLCTCCVICQEQLTSHKTPFSLPPHSSTCLMFTPLLRVAFNLSRLGVLSYYQHSLRTLEMLLT